MKMIWGAALTAVALASSPVAAQDAAVSNDDLHAAYAMTMMCLEATTTMAMKAEAAGDSALYQKLTDDGVVWLGVADSFGKDLGRTATDDLDMSIGRLVAEGNLLGDTVSDARQQQVYDACQQFLTPPPAPAVPDAPPPAAQ